ELMADYLESRYKDLEIKTERFRFVWQGIPQSNLIAKIKGSNRGASNKPILFADHFDTAFCQDVYDATKGSRVSAPGADDNYTATAALLRAAGILKNMKFKNDIWLVHFTGEEFPADDLGARKFVSELLKTKKDIGGLVLLDMIGHRENKDDMLFQINPGDSLQSLRLAAIAMDAAKSETTSFIPVLRTRFDAKGYLYNTDGLIFSDNGFPVVYFNEHINYEENLERVGYHDTKDTVDGRPADFLIQDIPEIENKKYHSGIDSKYASDLAKIAIETVARLAN
ncbi:MAG: M20/M25/M40 family metallo-hydrolase, partial [Bdellovibrionota bacterium]